jgi:UPF0489 domain
MIALVVVESHNHALEHIHCALRRRENRQLLLNTIIPSCCNERRESVGDDGGGWTLWHFDAHADLACPGHHVPAVACFQPRTPLSKLTRLVNNMNDNNNQDVADSDCDDDDDENDPCLYELLDSTASGIAEWILPLVLAANLRTVHWIRPSSSWPDSDAVESTSSTTDTSRDHHYAPWTPQIPLGVHHYRVGAWIPPPVIVVPPITAPKDCETDTSRHHAVNSFWDLPMQAVVKVDWQGSQYYRQDDATVPSSELVLSQPLRLNVREMDTDQTPLALDDSVPPFALDVCLDYFACENPFLTDLAALLHVPAINDLIQAFPRAVLASRLYAETDDQTIVSQCYQEELQHFNSLWKDWLESFCAAPASAAGDDHSDPAAATARREDGRPSPRTVTKDELLQTYYDSRSPPLLTHVEQLLLCDMNGSVRDDAIRLLVQAIPHVSMPHMAHDGEQMSLTCRAVQARLQQFQDALDRYWHTEENTTKTAVVASPFIITVARSVVDGFTPPIVVEELQAWVVNELHDRFCGCGRVPTTPIVASSSSSGGGDDDTSCRLRIVHDYGPPAESES